MRSRPVSERRRACCDIALRFFSSVFLGLLLLSVISVQVANAYNLNLLHLRWQTTPVSVYIVGSVLEPSWRQVIRQAIADWNAVGTSVQLIESSDFMAPITIYASSNGTCGDAPGCAFSDPDIFTTTDSFFNRCSVEINTRAPNQFTTTGESNKQDLYTLVAQELGHCLGLDHSSDLPNEPDTILRGAIMYYAGAWGNAGRHINSYDVAALKARYPTTTSAPPTPRPVYVNSSTFIADVTYPDGSVLSPSQSFNKIWRLRNTGTSTWNGFNLTFVNGNQMGGPASVAVPSTAPGQTVDITVTLVASSSGGNYRGNWQLKDSQGVNVSGGYVWVSIQVLGNAAPPPGGGGTPNTHITTFDVSPPSPSSASSVHLVARATYFSEFRSMRFAIGTDKVEMPNYRQVGNQLEISTNWNTASLARGSYALAVEVATKNDPNWTSAERQVKTYTLSGTPTASGRPPDRPILKEPYDWYLRDASGSSASVNMCVHASSDPDGDTVQYFFQVLNQIGDPVRDSGWTTSTCYSPTLSPGIYGWKVKAGNNNGALTSDWSEQTWHFSIASGGVSIDGYNLYQTADPFLTHICVPVSYGGISGPEVKAWVNRAADGSESGEWRLLDHYGPNTTPDCTQPNVHGFWIRANEYETGSHALRITAVKPDSGASATRQETYNIPYVRPSSFQPLAPSNYQNNNTFWNNPTGWYAAADVRDLAESTFGVRIGRASLPNEVLEPLKRAGLIDYRSGGTAGGKTSVLQTTSAFQASFSPNYS